MFGSEHHLRLEALIGGGENSADVIELATTLVRTLLPEMERLGVTTAGAFVSSAAR